MGCSFPFASFTWLPIIFFKNVSAIVFPHMSHFMLFAFLCVLYKAYASVNLKYVPFRPRGMEYKQFIGLFIIGIMVLSTIGLIVVNYTDNAAVTKLEYNDFTFRLANNQYFARIDGIEHGFVFFPGDLEFIAIPDDVKALLQSPVLTVTYDPQSNISENLGEAQYYFEVQLSDIKMIQRSLTNSSGTELPQASCADATDAQPVVDLRLSGVSGIKAEGNCIIVNSLDAYDLYQQTERIIYSVLGVMQ